MLKWAKWNLNPARDTDQDGLTEYHDWRDTSGDQSPRWDSQKINPKLVVGPIYPTEPVDANVWMSLLWHNLAEMARELGDDTAAANHEAISLRTMKLVEDVMWDENDGFYYDVDAGTHRKIRVKTPYGFMPMLSPHARPERVKRLVEEHLRNPEEFRCRYPLPSVSLDDPAFDPVDMWRGPTWINVNWMVIEGLARCGFADDAKELALRTVELVGPRRVGGRIRRSPRIWEWYHPLTGEPLGNNQYSWSALVIELIIRFISETTT